jgi:hypothetical protein
VQSDRSKKTFFFIDPPGIASWLKKKFRWSVRVLQAQRIRSAWIFEHDMVRCTWMNNGCVLAGMGAERQLKSSIDQEAVQRAGLVI